MSGITIGIGFGTARTGVPTPAEICSYAERAEDLGIDSIWLSDRITGAQLDIACVMALFAARTKKIKMGPSVLTLPAHNPVHVARSYATLDHLTGGRRRIIMAVGIGNDPKQCLAAGIPVEERGARMEEGVDVLRKLWSEPHVTHRGRFYQFEDLSIEPRPVGGPLDVWIGGRTDVALKRVARYGDGWFPRSSPRGVPHRHGEAGGLRGGARPRHRPPARPAPCCSATSPRIARAPTPCASSPPPHSRCRWTR
jgi:alkanesulfonate monooxygenase SsuD/methylene tetrahydromethanopterin reductase-like flavin-dependent oxidoreductase (luciferase family)